MRFKFSSAACFSLIYFCFANSNISNAYYWVESEGGVIGLVYELGPQVAYLKCTNFEVPNQNLALNDSIKLCANASPYSIPLITFLNSFLAQEGQSNVDLWEIDLFVWNTHRQIEREQSARKGQNVIPSPLEQTVSWILDEIAPQLSSSTQGENLGKNNTRLNSMVINSFFPVLSNGKIAFRLGESFTSYQQLDEVCPAKWVPASLSSLMKYMHDGTLEKIRLEPWLRKQHYHHLPKDTPIVLGTWAIWHQEKLTPDDQLGVISHKDTFRFSLNLETQNWITKHTDSIVNHFQGNAFFLTRDLHRDRPIPITQEKIRMPALCQTSPQWFAGNAAIPEAGENKEATLKLQQDLKLSSRNELRRIIGNNSRWTDTLYPIFYSNASIHRADPEQKIVTEIEYYLGSQYTPYAVLEEKYKKEQAYQIAEAQRIHLEELRKQNERAQEREARRAQRASLQSELARLERELFSAKKRLGESFSATVFIHYQTRETPGKSGVLREASMNHTQGRLNEVETLNQRIENLKRELANTPLF